uniref:TRP C-terminal domain-containing protein n=1 Tax=Amphimedon queenslandica TaxID=400682 RepID=A0A1X7UXX0_AMPQE
MDGLVWFLLFSCVVLGIAAQQDPCNDSYIEISVDSSASSSSCTNKNGSKCNSLQYVLSNLTLMNCTRISVDSNQVINSSITLRAIDGLILQGHGASINVTCVNQGSGFIFINCTNVEFFTIEWINCNMINFSSPVLCHLSSNGMVSEIFSRKYTSPSVQQDCNSVLHWEYQGPTTNKVMLGQDISLNDSFQFLHEPTVYAELACLLDGDTLKPCNGIYHLNGYRPPFSLSGRWDSSLKPVIMWYNATDKNSLIACMEIDVSKNCNLGYVYDSVKNICSCYSTGDDDSDVVKCNMADGTACIKTGYWYGAIDSKACSDKNQTSCTAAFPCPFGYCDYVSSNNCPTRPCSRHKFFCELDPDTSDTLCLYNRGGTLCSSCQANYSLSFDGIRCVDNDDCTSGSLVLYILIFILFWVLLTFVIVAVTKLNLRIGSGQLYCLVFFFSVLQYFVRGSFPSIFLYVLELVFTGFMQLDPKMFGLFEVCLKYRDITNIHYVSLCCINPLFLTLVIGLLICVSSRCPKYALFTQNNSAVNMICIVLYLVFISLTQTSLSLLAPVYYTSNIHKPYVALEPNVTYFNPEAHLSYAVFAILIQIILVIPFLFLLIFAPCLIRIGALNLTRIKPILDEYQACYKEQYRSFAGFYLTSRQLIFLISLFPISTTTYIYILQILSILLLTVHCIVQPYTSLRLNIFDGLLILDLVLLSILHGSTANVVFGVGRGLELKTAFVYLLVLFPVIYFVGMCFVQFAKFTFWKNVDCNFNKSKRKSRQTRDHAKSTPVDPEDDPEEMEREPLLFQSNLSYESLVVNSKEENRIAPGKVTVVQVTH